MFAILAGWVSNNALKLGVIAAAIAFVGGSLWWIKHQAYKEGYSTGYAEMQALHDDEVAKSKREVAEAMALNARIITKAKQDNEDKLREVLNDKEKAIDTINADYKRALNRRLFVDTTKAGKGGSDTMPSKTSGARVNDQGNSQGERVELDRRTAKAILDYGYRSQRLVDECNAYLDLTEKHIEVIQD